MRASKLVVLIASIAICELAGAIGSVFTVQSIPTWYASLTKPAFTPPGWLFGPVWILLYLLMGMSLYLVYSSRKQGKSGTNAALYAFAVQLVLNVAWSIVFFGLKSISYRFVTILLLLISIIITIILFFRSSKTAGTLLLPYLFWVTFASVLNYSILILNHV